jgi:peptide/nickel transport system permease protein
MSAAASALRQIARTPSLLVGLVIMLPLLVAIGAPHWIAPADPEARGPAIQFIDGRWMAPPYPPGSEYPLGSDLRARDMLSRIIYGARITLLLAFAATAIRIGIGVLLGWAAATYPGVIERAITLIADISGMLPGLLFAFLLIATIGPHRGLPIFLLGLGLTGWAAWTQLIYAGIRRIQAQPYMEAAIAIGATRRSQLRHYMLPNLLPIAIPVAAQEIAAVLLLLAELGFLGIYIGSTTPIRLSDLIGGEQPQLPAPEWGGMLAGTRLEIFRWYWLPIIPAAAFFLTILGLHLLADGLRQQLDKAPVR